MPRVDGRPEDGQYRPVIEVILRYGGKSIPILALVDSGADLTTIPEALGEALTGLPVAQIGRPGADITGMGDPTRSRILDGVELVYMGRVFARSVIIGKAPRNVLGRNDFMKTFDVRFYWGHDSPEFWIEPTQPAGRRSAPRPTNPTIRPKRRR